MYYILTTGLRNPCQTDASLSSYSWGSEKEVSKYNPLHRCRAIGTRLVLKPPRHSDQRFNLSAFSGSNTLCEGTWSSRPWTWPHPWPSQSSKNVRASFLLAARRKSLISWLCFGILEFWDGKAVSPSVLSSFP